MADMDDGFELGVQMNPKQNLRSHKGGRIMNERNRGASKVGEMSKTM